jgi:hypothetical protein
VELPRLETLYRKYQDQGLSVIAIEAVRDRKGAEKFITDNDLSYFCLENGEGEDEVVRNIYGVSGFPTSFLVGPDGKIMYAHLGFEEGDEEKIEKQILSLLGS